MYYVLLCDVQMGVLVLVSFTLVVYLLLLPDLLVEQLISKERASK